MARPMGASHATSPEHSFHQNKPQNNSQWLIRANSTSRNRKKGNGKLFCMRNANGEVFPNGWKGLWIKQQQIGKVDPKVFLFVIAAWQNRRHRRKWNSKHRPTRIQWRFELIPSSFITASRNSAATIEELRSSSSKNVWTKKKNLYYFLTMCLQWLLFSMTN